MKATDLSNELEAEKTSQLERLYKHSTFDLNIFLPISKQVKKKIYIYTNGHQLDSTFNVVMHDLGSKYVNSLLPIA